MNHDLKPYPRMKESGVPWIGKVPEHWEVQRGKWLFRHRKQINVDRVSSNVLSLTLRGVVNNDPNNPEGLVPADYATYQLFRKGDLVFKLIDLENLRTSRVGLVHEDGIMSSAYVRLSPQTGGNIRFFFQQYFDLYQRGIYNQLGAGVRSTLGPNDLLNLSVVVPPLVEQSAIVRFLDYVDRRIRSHVRAKQKLIKLLEEQKQTVIHRAVTRSLDGDSQLKSSGVESLGRLPAHWDVVPLRRRWRVTDCKHLTVPFVEEGIPLASVREAQNFDLSLADANRTTVDWYATLVEGGRKPRRGDLIYCRNVGVGAAAFVDTDEQFAMGQDVCLISSLNENQRYLNYFLHSPVMDRQLAALLVGSTFPRINVSDVKALLIFVPPRAEQDRIVIHLDGLLKRINGGIGAAAREVSLLREFRSRLIADVVTGKLDVREVAASLPDESGQEDSLLVETEPMTEYGLEEDGSTVAAELEEVDA